MGNRINGKRKGIQHAILQDLPAFDCQSGKEGENARRGDFFRQAPSPNPARTLITGTVCGVRVEDVQDGLMREMRYLDKLVDELAKGKPMEKILS